MRSLLLSTAIVLTLVVSPAYASHDAEEVRTGCMDSLARILHSYVDAKSRGVPLDMVLAELLARRDMAADNGSVWGTEENHQVFVVLLTAVYRDSGIDTALDAAMRRCLVVMAEPHPKQQM